MPLEVWRRTNFLRRYPCVTDAAIVEVESASWDAPLVREQLEVVTERHALGIVMQEVWDLR